MKLQNRFVAMLIGENCELRQRKADGVMYSFRTVAVMQNGLVDNLRVEENLFNALKDMEHFKQYDMFAYYDTQYGSYVVSDMKPFGLGNK